MRDNSSSRSRGLLRSLAASRHPLLAGVLSLLMFLPPQLLYADDPTPTGPPPAGTPDPPVGRGGRSPRRRCQCPDGLQPEQRGGSLTLTSPY